MLFTSTAAAAPAKLPLLPLLQLMLLLVLLRPSAPLAPVRPRPRATVHATPYGASSSSSALGLYRLTDADLPAAQCMPDAAQDWDFHLLETADLPDASSLALDSFYKPRLKLDLTGMNGLEKWLWGGLLQVYLDMDRSDNYNGNYLGFRSRSSKRLDRPSFDLSTYSFILAATPKATATASGSSSSSSFSNSNSTGSGSNSVGNAEIAAVVEICLERPTGKLAPPIQNPFRSAVAKANEQPYLCNLCVATKRELVTASPLLLP